MTRAESSPLPIGSADRVVVGGDAHRCVLRLRGEHDITPMSAVAASLRQVVANGGADVVFDLREVELMDASTIGVTVGARNQFALQRRVLSVRSRSVCPQRLIDACGLTDLIDPSPAGAGATQVVGASGALGTWVAVATTERATAQDEAVAGKYWGADVPVIRGPAADSGRRETEAEAAADHGER